MEQQLNKNMNQSGEFKWNKALRVGFIWIVILLAAIIFTQLWKEDDGVIIEISFIEYQKIG